MVSSLFAFANNVALIIVSAVLALKVHSAHVRSWKGLHDGRNEDAVLVPSDEDISVADETNGHYVSFFRSFFQSKKYLIVTWLVIRCSFFFIPARRDSLYDLFPLTLFLFFNSLSIPSHDRPTLVLLFYLL